VLDIPVANIINHQYIKNVKQTYFVIKGSTVYSSSNKL